MKFQKGDEVKVVADEKRLIKIGILNQLFKGLRGEIIKTDGIADIPYRVNFTNLGDLWWFAEQDLELIERESETPQEDKLIPVSHTDYMSLSDAYDKHSRILMSSKGEEYAIEGDFLAMENRLAGMLGDSPEYVSLVMAGKHITAIGIILEKNDVTKIKLEKLDERIRDATNLLKIASTFIHAKQNDFSLHLGKGEK